MGSAAAKDIFFELFAAFSSDDAVAARKLIADDAVWRFPGRTGQLAGDHVGADSILAFLQKVRDLTDGTFELTAEQIVAEDNTVIVLFTGSGERNGRILANPTCLVLEFAGNKLQQVREFVWDLPHVEEFWT